jgi:hypothetical protein
MFHRIEIHATKKRWVLFHYAVVIRYWKQSPPPLPTNQVIIDLPITHWPFKIAASWQPFFVLVFKNIMYYTNSAYIVRLTSDL